MQISDKRLPPKPSLQIHPDTLVREPLFCQGVALAIAIWADIEARLDGIFIAMVRDEDRFREFRDAKGWGKRSELFVEAVRSVKGGDVAIEVKAILAEVSVSAKLRNELAHGIWASCKEAPGTLALLGSEMYTEAIVQALEAEAAASPKMLFDERKLLKSARLIELSQLQEAVAVLFAARNLIHTFMIEAMPDIVYVHGRNELGRAKDHPGVTGRVINAKRSLKSVARKKARLDEA